MFGIDFIPGAIMGLREGLEAFLIIAIMLEYLRKINKPEYKKNVYMGLSIGIGASLIFGLLLFGISGWIGTSTDSLAKLWEFAASFLALILITTFIFYMIKHASSITKEIRDKMDLNLSAKGILFLAAVMVAREGVEVSLFAFASANEGGYLVGAFSGILLSALLAFLIYKSLIKVNLSLLFKITLIYLILQAGFMLGYSVHELLSFLKAEEILASSNILFTKLFDASNTFLYHKEQPIGIFLYVTIGWYSKPEVIQFVLQYAYTIGLLVFFFKQQKK